MKEKKAKFTPGPWGVQLRTNSTLDRIASQYCVIHGPKGESQWVADVGFGHNGSGSGSIANARLIAAAPDLLECLIECLPIVDAYRRISGGDGDMAAENACAAISRALGEL